MLWTQQLTTRTSTPSTQELHFIRTCALHPQQEEHRDDGQEGSDGISDDVLEGVVVGDEKDVEHGGGRKISGEQAACVGKNCPRLDHRQAEEGDRPDAMENLKFRKYFNFNYLVQEPMSQINFRAA